MLRNYGCGFVNLMAAAPSTCPSNQVTIDKIKSNAQVGDIVVLSSFSTPRIAELWGPLDKQRLLAKVESKEAQLSRDRVLETSIEIVRTLQQFGVTVVLAAPTPVFEAPPDRCRRWFNRHNPVCAPGFETARDYQLELRAPVMKSYQALSKETGAALWDPFPLLCPADPCQSKVDDRFRYIDQHHISANGNIVVFKSFLKLAHSIWDGTYNQSAFEFTPASSKQ